MVILTMAYTDIWTFCPSKVLGNSKVTVSSMDDSELSTAPSDNPRVCWLLDFPLHTRLHYLPIVTYCHKRLSKLFPHLCEAQCTCVYLVILYAPAAAFVI